MRGMPHLGADLIFIILQFLKEQGYKEAAHELECESGVYFDWSHFEELMLNGKWNEAENYLSGFTQLEDNAFSMKIYFEMRKQKYLEALDRGDVPKALDILRSDLKVFEGNKELFQEMTELLTLDNIRRNNKLAMYGDTQNARSAIRWEIKKDIALNPALHGKLILPRFELCRLELIINQSLNWQHSHCAYPAPNPVIHTLLADHRCETRNRPVVPPADDALASSQDVPMSISSSVGGPSTPFTVARASEPRAAVCLSHAANSGDRSVCFATIPDWLSLRAPAGSLEMKTNRLDTALEEDVEVRATHGDSS